MKFLLLILIYFLPFTSMAQTENQKYIVTKKINEIEIREYLPSIYASVTLEENNAKQNSLFRILANYIFGGNSESQKIAMTAPVHMQKNNTEGKDAMTMKFVMPSKYKLNDLSKPNDPRINIYKSKQKKYAAIGYGGYNNDYKNENYYQKLKNILIQNNLKFSDNPIYLGYDPPYKFWGRKNEILLELE
tara:strand:+ start:746 stop:1312 length:567 start_codon:yes stop_codon:yes gene_type:complete